MLIYGREILVIINKNKDNHRSRKEYYIGPLESIPIEELGRLLHDQKSQILFYLLKAD